MVIHNNIDLLVFRQCGLCPNLSEELLRGLLSCGLTKLVYETARKTVANAAKDRNARVALTRYCNTKIGSVAALGHVRGGRLYPGVH